MNTLHRHRHLNPERVAERLAVFAHPTRIRLLLEIELDDDRSVSQLAKAVNIHQAVASHHLQKLEQAKIIRLVRCGHMRCPQFMTPQMKRFFHSLTKEIDLTI